MFIFNLLPDLQFYYPKNLIVGMLAAGSCVGGHATMMNWVNFRFVRKTV